MRTTAALCSKFLIFCSTYSASHISYWWGSAGIQLTCAYRSWAPETVFTASVVWHWHKLLRILKLPKNHIQREHQTGKQVVKQGTVQRLCCWVGCFAWSTGCIPWKQSPYKPWYKRTSGSEILYSITQNTVRFRTVLALPNPRLTYYQKEKLYTSEKT